MLYETWTVAPGCPQRYHRGTLVTVIAAAVICFTLPVFDLCELWSTILPNISFLDIYDDYYDMMMMMMKWSYGVGMRHFFFKKKTFIIPWTL